MGLITHKMLLLYAYRHWNFQLRIERDVISDIQAILNRDDNENTRLRLKEEAEAMAERLEAELVKRGALTIDMTCEIKNVRTEHERVKKLAGDQGKDGPDVKASTRKVVALANKYGARWKMPDNDEPEKPQGSDGTVAALTRQNSKGAKYAHGALEGGVGKRTEWKQIGDDDEKAAIRELERFMEEGSSVSMPTTEFVTTIHMISSAITKLSGQTPIPNDRCVYRGMCGVQLPLCFDIETLQGCRAGVDGAFMSCTTKKEIAVQYATNRDSNPILFRLSVGGFRV
jgi:hypothetical protein